jgi:glycosyltransferase involved in cell wall biosynthesis
MPMISIVVPVYNVEACLRQCLDRVLSQTFTDYECLLVDDASPDNCPAICDEYAAKYSRFKVIHKANGGLSSARNAGIRAALGDYLIFLDSDDLFASDDALQNLSDIITENNMPVIFNSNLTKFIDGDFKNYDGLPSNRDIIYSAVFYKELMRNPRMLLAAWRFVVERRFLIDNDLFFKEGILHEDEHWMPRLFCVCERIAVNHARFYAYRTTRDGSIMSIITPRRLLDKIIIIREIESWITKKAYPKDKLTILRWRMAQLWYGIFSQTIQLRENNQDIYYKISSELYKLRYMLFGGKELRYPCFYIAISLIGVPTAHEIISKFRTISASKTYKIAIKGLC